MFEPELSVVIPSVNGFSDLRDCLDALLRQSDQVRLELLVIERCGESVRRSVRERYPSVVLIEVEPSVTIPQMRALAFDRATAPAVAVIEDHVIVPPTWARQLLDAMAGGERVVAGAVENAATTTTLDWAAFLCEYSHCLPPLPAGPAEWLTGNNVVYPRALLQRYRAVAHEGKWENYLHDTVKAAGVPLVCEPSIVVGHKKHYTFGEYLTQRYLYSRSYAGARASSLGLAKRLVFGAASLALPPVLFYRTVSRIRAKGRHTDKLPASLPLIAIFVVSWALGEAVGSVFGAGDSLQKVC